jgi:hypothetical protein
LSFFICIDPADFFAERLICPAAPAAPPTSLMILKSEDKPMCPGKKATFKCDAGGINAFSVTVTRES